MVISLFFFETLTKQVALFSGLFVSHVIEARVNLSFSQCELIMRQAIIKMFALIVCRVIRCSLQYTREIKLGHAWWKELRSPTISQLPHNCEVG